MATIKQTASGAAKGTGLTAFVLIGAPLIGFGVPLFWVWVASQLAGTHRQVTVALALFIATGMLVSYWLILLGAGHLRTRLVGEQAVRAKVRRASWNRSFRDEPHGDQRSDPIERLFMVTAIVGFIAFELWFMFFAGSPLDPH
jgi:hypothetical protein